MIRAEQSMMGITIEFEGSTGDLLYEFTMVTRSIYQMLEKKYNKKFADKVIADCGRFAVLNDDDEFGDLDEVLAEAKRAVQLAIGESNDEKGEDK